MRCKPNYHFCAAQSQRGHARTNAARFASHSRIAAPRLISATATHSDVPHVIGGMLHSARACAGGAGIVSGVVTFRDGPQDASIKTGKIVSRTRRINIPYVAGGPFR